MTKPKKKKYVILHIETGTYIYSSTCQIVYDYFYPNIAGYHWLLTVSLRVLADVGIDRRDFTLKKDAIYFKDKVSAITFLRDVYIPTLNESWFGNSERKFNRNEFEIIEV